MIFSQFPFFQLSFQPAFPNFSPSLFPPFSPSPFPLFQVRIGIHTGSVIAGVVGDKKFAYDIWGDTVNTASRMESSGKVGKVNISGTTYKLINTYEKLNMIYRGEIEAKNKGRIKMYFVERKL